ncbi:hypothetical protein XENOCAPTIV_004503 [Xenoophorus captivus]|uniref:Uncharacterized protein n=1 Tax=Xenoophorus captivus TaxID=1517983 RepID=A0ABV0QYR1_9TELE
MQLDLGNLKSVRSFTETFLKSEPRLDILINNAGAISSELGRNTSLFLQIILKPITTFFFKNTIQGCQTTLHCALQAGIEPLSGRYFSNCTVRDLYAKAKDDAAAKKLWEMSERLCALV